MAQFPSPLESEVASALLQLSTTPPLITPPHLQHRADAILNFLSGGCYSEAKIREVFRDTPDTSKTLRMWFLLSLSFSNLATRFKIFHASSWTFWFCALHDSFSFLSWRIEYMPFCCCFFNHYLWNKWPNMTNFKILTWNHRTKSCVVFNQNIISTTQRAELRGQ